MDITTITTAYNGLKAGKDILKSLYDMKVAGDAKEKIDRVLQELGIAQDALFAMREALFQLQEENANLTEEVKSFRSWEKQLADYTLAETEGGAVVYAFNGEPKHYICPSCTEDRRKEILQDRKVFTGLFACPKCDSQYPVKRQQDTDLDFDDDCEPSY